MARRRRLHSRPVDLFPGFSDVTEIATGRRSVVYRAREADTDRPVALRLLPVPVTSARSIESFEGNSRLLTGLNAHPNLVTLHRTFRTQDGRPVLVLELCVGALSDRLRDGRPLPVRETVAIGIKIAGALETAHRAGMLHGHVTPRKILVTEFGEPALGDLGAALLSAAAAAGVCDISAVRTAGGGAAVHAAPELLEDGSGSAATDVYGLASTLYRLLAGRPAFGAYDGEPPAAVILRVLREPVRPLPIGVALQLSDVLVAAMAKRADERPATAAEFAAQLRAVEVAEGWTPTTVPLRSRPTTQLVAPRGLTAAVASGPVGAPATAGWTPPEYSSPAPGAVIEHASAASAANGRPQLVPTTPAEPPRAVPPAMVAPERAGGADVPRWAVRPIACPGPEDVPQSAADVSSDPELRDVELRAGRPKLQSRLSAVTVNDDGLIVRHGVRRRRIDWDQILAFEAHPGADESVRGSGMLLVLTTHGPVELPGHAQSPAELRARQAELTAYLLRARGGASAPAAGATSRRRPERS